MKRFLWLMVTIVILTSSKAQAQGNDPFSLQQLTPRSPNAAAFEKYLQVPVNLNAGQLGLSVPLYNIQSRDIQVPIVLTYNNSGLKLGEIPSWTGLGWDLNVGGVILQRTKGTPDDDTFGMLNQLGSNDIRNFEGLTETGKVNFMRKTFSRQADMQNDVFAFTFPGKSGSFYINGPGECVPVIDGNMKISYEPSVGGGRITSFTMTDDRGLRYVFGMREESYTQEGTLIGAAWYLTEIASPSGGKVEFKYKQRNLSYAELAEGVWFSYGVGGIGDPYTYVCQAPARYQTGSKSILANNLLTEVIFDGGKAIFTSETIREDVKQISGFVGTNINSLEALDKIEIVSTYNNTAIRTFEFSYANSSSRLFLRKVAEREPGSAVAGKEHQFTYYNEDQWFPSLDKRGSSFKMQDHWGYYNGISNATLIPSIEYAPYIFNSAQPGHFAGADRSANAQYSVTGVIKSIQYPTGGEARFFYEPNKKTFPNKAAVPSILFKEPLQPNPVTILEHTTQQSEIKNVVLSSFSDLFFTEIWVHDGDPNYPLPSVDMPGYIKKNVVVYETELGPGQYYIERTYEIEKLDAGTYPVQINATNAGQHLELTVKAAPAYNVNLPIEIELGGVRVKRVEMYDGTNLVSQKIYSYTDPAMRTAPDYVTLISYMESGGVRPGEVHLYYCSSGFTFSSMAYNHPSTFHIEYLKVEEADDLQRSNGYTEYNFSWREPSYYDEIGRYFIDFTESLSGGDLVSKKTFERNGANAFRLLRNEVNEYGFSEFTHQRQFNYMFNYPQAWASTNIEPGNGDEFTENESDKAGRILYLSKLFRYKLPWYRKGLYNTIVTDYQYADEQSTIPSVTTVSSTKNLYAGVNPNYISAIESSTSKNGVKTKRFKYVQDVYFSEPAVEAARQQLIQQHNISAVLEETEEVDGRFISRKRLQYSLFNNLVLPGKVSVQVNGYTEEDRLKFDLYDSKGNLLQQAKVNDVKQAYIWGYNNMYPVAEIVGVDYTAAIAVLDVSILQQPASEDQLQMELNKLRIHFPQASIQTYTYKPLVGVSRITDRAGRTQYYQYNGLGQLSHIKNDQGNVLKVFDYKYKVPAQ